MHGRVKPTACAHRVAFSRALLVVLLWLAAWPRASLRAQDHSCSRVRVQLAAAAPERWQQAVRAMCNELGSTPDVDPAAHVWIVANDAEAVVEVTLADGRNTVRHVRSPEHLFATVEALVVIPTLPAPMTAPPSAAKPRPVQQLTAAGPTPELQPSAAEPKAVHPPSAADPKPVPQLSAAKQRSASAPPSERRTDPPALELGSSLIGRISGAPVYLAVGFSIYAGVRLRQWLLALSVRWDALETLIDEVPRGFEMDSVGAGFLLSRELFETGTLGLQVAGLTQLLAATQSIEIAEVETTETAVDVRLGLQSRLLLGAPPLRWTLALEGELSPLRLQRPLKLYATLPSWSLGLGIGVAWEPR